jgi:hypothetical protein
MWNPNFRDHFPFRIPPVDSITGDAGPDSNCFLSAATIQKQMARCTLSANVSSDRYSFHQPALLALIRRYRR